MKIIVFFHYIFKNFPRLITLNILILILAGVLDSTAILSLTPVIDVLVNTDVEKMSTITRKIIGYLADIGLSASLTNLLIIFIIFNAIRSLLIIFSRYFILNTKYALLRKIILGTFDDFFRARWLFFSNSKQGTLLNTFMREITVVGDAFGAMAGFFAQIVQCMLFLVVPLFLSWQVSLIAICCATLFALPFGLVGRITYRLGKMNTATANEIGSVIQENLGSAKLVTGFSNQSTSLGYLARAFDAHRNVTIKSQTLEAAVPLLYYPLGIVVLAITLVSSKYFTVPLSEVVAMIYSFLRIIMLVGTLTAQKNSLNNFFPSYEQVMSLRQSARDLKQKTGTRLYTEMKRGITLEGVAFAYPGNKPVLKDINVEIKKGSMVAIVGRSGSGKSTLVDMIMGFNEPLQGTVCIDDISLYEFNIDSYRKRLGYVPQESILFNMSIRNNLLWSRKEATTREIEDACSAANAAEFIDQLPDGYDTIVGDRGVRLSGGQVQRIALARAILRRPDILILDEATSSLDTQSERLIQEAIEKIARKTTVIVIAHRLSTIVNADYIYVLEDGRVVEEGTYAQLCKNNETFGEMVKMQLVG